MLWGMTALRLVSLGDAVVFPGMPMVLPADIGGDQRVLLIPKRGNAYAKIGVVAEVAERLPGVPGVIPLTGLHRGIPGAAHTDPDGVLRVDVEKRPDVTPPADLTQDENLFTSPVSRCAGARPRKRA